MPACHPRGLSRLALKVRIVQDGCDGSSDISSVERLQQDDALEELCVFRRTADDGGYPNVEGEREAASPERVDLERERAHVHREHVFVDFLLAQWTGVDHRSGQTHLLHQA